MNDGSQIPEERVFLFYLGNFLVVVGILMFLSVLVQGISSVRSGPQFYSEPTVQISPGMEWTPASTPSRPSEPNPMVALVGMGFMVVGGILSGVGKAGLAGSGIVLDPQQQRQDMKPWSKMAGGMLSDAVEEMGTNKPVSSVQDVVKVRCPTCRTLNDENAKFCDECGKPL